MSFKTIIEPFKIKTVEPIFMSTPEERAKYLEKAFYNPFKLSSDEVIIDMLTDSGTSAMSADQWAGVMTGDESYAGSKSWAKMEHVIKDLTGFDYILPTHQAEPVNGYFTVRSEAKIKFLSATRILILRAQILNIPALRLLISPLKNLITLPCITRLREIWILVNFRNLSIHTSREISAL